MEWYGGGLPSEAIRMETGRDMGVVGVEGSLEARLVEEAARRWRTDLLKMACGSEGEGWGRGDLEDLRGLVRDCGRVRERRRLVLDLFCA